MDSVFYLVATVFAILAVCVSNYAMRLAGKPSVSPELREVLESGEPIRKVADRQRKRKRDYNLAQHLDDKGMWYRTCEGKWAFCKGALRDKVDATKEFICDSITALISGYELIMHERYLCAEQEIDGIAYRTVNDAMSRLSIETDADSVEAYTALRKLHKDSEPVRLLPILT